MAASIVVPGRAYCQNYATGVIAAGWLCVAVAPAATMIIRSANRCMLLRYVYFCVLKNVLEERKL